MKRSLLTLAGMSLLASPAAFASKARTQALGQDNASFYISDMRDVIVNPSNYVDYNNFVIFEWGDDNNTGAEAEGGFARQSGNFVYAVYLGNDSDRSTGSIASAPTFVAEKNSIDLSIAGDAGVKWGITLAYSSQEEAAETAPLVSAEGDRLQARAGVMGANWDAYLKWTINNEVTGSSDGSVTPVAVVAADKYEQDGFTLGATYSWQDWKFFGDYTATNVTVTDSTQTTSAAVDSDTTVFTLGAGNTHKLNDKATMWWSVQYMNSQEDYGVFGATAKGENNSNHVQLHVALEAQATSWLTLRGGVKQNVLIDNTDTKGATDGATSIENKGLSETTVTAGLGLTFDKLMVDGTVGTTTGGYSLGGSAADGSTFGNVGVHYWF